MEKTYDPQAIEQKWYPEWEKNGYFEPQGSGEPYCIMIPPPNVTGSLHMGHGFQLSLMDTLIRYHRMKGDKTLWQVGTDHAGISTQMVVERQLLEENKSRHDLGREIFVERVWKWKQESGSMITNQLRRIGASVDWSRERFTLDPQMSRAVQEVFITLYQEGLIYRGQRLVNWDPVFRTAISDLEVISEEEQGFLWYIRYPLSESNEYVIVATTRPETLLGDAAVAVNPADPRYQHLIGKQINLPLTTRQIPIIADDYVEMEFGTGCVKITPAHDFNDYEMGKRHQLPLINIFTADAKINHNAPAAYQNLDRFDARKKVVEDLKNLNLLEKVEPHLLKVPRNDRGNAIIEPYLTDQWFVKTEPLAEKAITAVEKGETRFVPEAWTKTYFQWMHNIQDWCISRQLWWGHRIPAWYDEKGKIYVGRSESEIRSQYHLDGELVLRQDEDVLDTWFSSALWPFATLGWPEQTEDLKNFYPTNVLVTGFDIIFFWVARMMMMGIKFTNQVPFHDVYITGLIRDSEGQKMSKTKGNVLDPLDLIDGVDLETLISKRTRGLMQPAMAQKIEKNTRKEFPEGIPAFGTDALRFTFCALASTGRDIRFDLGRLEGYRNFCNKIWNAARYVLMNIENYNEMENFERSPADNWIVSKLQEAITQTTHYLEQYRFDLATQTIYEFTWYEFCDWYLELSKPVLTSESSTAAQKSGTQKTLIEVLETLLRVLHPFIPFITEEIWQQLKPFTRQNSATIMLAPFPVANEDLINHNIEKQFDWLKAVILAVRNIRGEMNISPSKKVPLLVYKGNDVEFSAFDTYKEILKVLAKLESIQWIDSPSQLVPSAMALVGELELHIPMEGLIDKEAESKRLKKEMEKLIIDLQKCEQKLENPNYVNKAPAEVVMKERERVEDLKNSLQKLKEKLLFQFNQ